MLEINVTTAPFKPGFARYPMRIRAIDPVSATLSDAVPAV
jgi:hypothetical protein